MALATGCRSATPMSSPWPRHPLTNGESIAGDRGAQLRAARGGVGDEVGALDLGEDRRGDGGAERVAAERRAVRAGVEQLAGVAVGDERADREPAADALGHRDRVGGDAGVLEGEPLPRAPRAGLDLVDDQQRAVLLGERARSREVALRQLDDARLTLDRLDEQRGDAIVEGRFERLDRGVDELDARGHRQERLLHVRLAGEGERAHRAAVEGVGEGEDARALGAAVQPGELERGLVRLGAGVAEVDAAGVARAGEALEPRRELELRLGREVVRDVRERRGLLRDRVDEDRVRVAERVHGDPREEVEVAAAVVVPQVGALAAREQRHPVAEAPHEIARRGIPPCRRHPTTTSVPIP